MESLKNVIVPSEVGYRTTEVSQYSRQELAAHLLVANLLGDEGRRINDFTVRDMRVESGKCVMRCLRNDDEGKWSEGDAESLKNAHCDAELVNVSPENQGDETTPAQSVQMEVSVPLYILREIEERCKVEIEMIERDVFRKTGRILMDVDEEERKNQVEDKDKAKREGKESAVGDDLEDWRKQQAENDDEEKIRMAA